MKKNRSSLCRELFIPARKYLRIMRFTFIFMLWGLMAFASVSYSQSTRLTFELTDVTIESVFKQIEELSEFKFAYNSTRLDITRKINISAENQTIDAILKEILGLSDYRYRIVDRYIIITDKNGQDLTEAAALQSKKVSGKVTDTAGMPLPGVSVIIRGTTTGAITDANGNYSILNVPENAILQFSFVGMKPQDIVVGYKAVIHVKLYEETIGL